MPVSKSHPTSYKRPIDENATRRARARYRLKLMKLQQVFGILQERDASDRLLPPPPKVMQTLLACAEFGDPSGHGRPFRMRPGVPPIRDAFHQARHRRNKAARAARKANR